MVTTQTKTTREQAEAATTVALTIGTLIALALVVYYEYRMHNTLKRMEEQNHEARQEAMNDLEDDIDS